MRYHRRFIWVVLVVIVTALAMPLSSWATDKIELSMGQTVYVPAYSHIYVGNKEQPFLLTVTLSIRNVDLRRSLTLSAVDYYETQGKLIKKYLAQPTVLGPLESVRFIVPQKDKAGGSGANFIVAWTSQTAINPPLIETVMIGAESQQGISFTSRGQVIEVDK